MVKKKSICFSFFRNQKRKPRLWWEAGGLMNQRRLVSDTPEHWLSGAERDDARITEWVGCRDTPGFLDECHGIRVARKTVEVSAMETGEGFELVECSDRSESLSVERERDRSRVAARAAASRFFRISRVRCRVGTEEEFRIAGGGGPKQRLAMFFALEDWETVVVRSDTSCKEIITVAEEMMRCDGRGDIRAGCLDKLDSWARGDVLEHDTEIGEGFNDFVEGWEKSHFPIEDVDVSLMILEGFSMNRQHKSVLFHGSEYRVELADIADPSCGIGRGVGWVELGRKDVFTCGGDDDVSNRGVVGQVDGHEWIEVPTPVLLRRGFERLEDPAAIVECVAGLPDRRPEIGHDEGSPEDAGGSCKYGPHCISVTQMQVPVIGSGDGEASGLRHGVSPLVVVVT